MRAPRTEPCWSWYSLPRCGLWGWALGTAGGPQPRQRCGKGTPLCSPPSSWRLIICCQLHTSRLVPPSWHKSDVLLTFPPPPPITISSRVGVLVPTPKAGTYPEARSALVRVVPQFTYPTTFSFLTTTALPNLAGSFFGWPPQRNFRLSFAGSERVAVCGPQVGRLGAELQQRGAHRRTVPCSPIGFPFQ